MSKLDREAAVIEASGLFDRAWYLAEYPDVAASGMDPLAHYLSFGARLLRNPGPGFDTRRYQIVERNALSVGDNPLVHYLTTKVGRRLVGGGDPARSLRIAIKIAVPSQKVKRAWGDYHFAFALKRAFARLGHDVRIDLRLAWDGNHCHDDQVALVLRGRVAYKPRSEQLNLMWNISHPEDVSPAEYEEYDHVFVASLSYARELSRRVNVAVTSLLQCTDPDIFNPDVEPIEPSPGLLFIGNSRNTYRRIVKDAIEAGLRPEIYGTLWESFLPQDMIKGTNIPNKVLARYYRSCRCLLNDHWDDMRARGFLSNRLFDAVACGARIVSDRVDGIEDVFGEAVAVYDSRADLPAVIEQFEEREGATRHISKFIRREHNFDARVKVILRRIGELCPYLFVDDEVRRRQLVADSEDPVGI
jgi:spore maturation protein CgeB